MFPISSINCIGFFGADVARLGDLFCPLGVDDEEWISGVLPLLTRRVGRVLGGNTVAHYSFYTQEFVLNQTDILDKYYSQAGVFRRHPFPRSRTDFSAISPKAFCKALVILRNFNGLLARYVKPPAGCLYQTINCRDPLCLVSQTFVSPAHTWYERPCQPTAAR
jgi:hypothetical protein